MQNVINSCLELCSKTKNPIFCGAMKPRHRKSVLDCTVLPLLISGIIGAIASISHTESAFADPMQLRQVLQTRVCDGCDLSREKLSFANLRGASLRNANLFSADLKLTDLREANLIGAILDKADLRGADLTGANLTGAYMSETNFCGAIMPDGQKSSEGCPQPTKTTK